MALDDLSLTFAALADPTRRAILARLVTGEATVTELSEPFELSGPAVCKHLKVLEKAGLIAQGRQAQWRPRRIQTDRLAAVDAWLNLYRPLWEARFDRMADHLKKLQENKSNE